MPSKPSRADQELADQATAAGYPTTGDQVRELHERKVLPAKIVRRQGRGAAMSQYPAGSLDVLVAVRRARTTPGYGKLYRAVSLAWLRGADVRSEALLDALLRVTDDGARTAARGFPRRHRESDGEGLLALDPGDRQAVLGTVAMMLAEIPIPLEAVGAVQNTASLIYEAARKLPAPPGCSDGAGLLPSGHSRTLAQALAGVPVEGQAIIDLSVTGIRASLAIVLPEHRRKLDELRDRVLSHVSSSDLSLAAEEELLGVIVGQVHGLLTIPRRKDPTT